MQLKSFCSFDWDILSFCIAGLQLEVGGSPATVADLPFASRRFLSDVLVSASGATVGSPVLGPGAEVMAQQAAKERLVKYIYSFTVLCAHVSDLDSHSGIAESLHH